MQGLTDRQADSEVTQGRAGEEAARRDEETRQIEMKNRKEIKKDVTSHSDRWAERQVKTNKL